MGPPELDCEWQDAGLEGIKRFLNRLWNYLTNPEHILAFGQQEDSATTRRLHKFLKDYQERITHFKPNTAISAMMEWLNDTTAQSTKLSTASVERLLVALSVMAPHMASELVEQLLKKSLSDCSWQPYDPLLAQVDELTIAIQVNGKLRGNLLVKKGAIQPDVEPKARELIAKWLDQATVIKVIFVTDRLISFVVKNN